MQSVKSHPRKGAGKSSLIISRKPDGAGAACQLWIVKVETIWVADAHRDDKRRFVVRVEEILTAFVELERAIHEFAVDLIS